jgi:16S rRNA (uracil1498-N3)-methyltransferase
VVEPLFRFTGDLVDSSTVNLDGPEGHHAASVRRVRVGERVQLTDGAGIRARGAVAGIAPKSITVAIDEVILEELPALKFGLVQALAKGDRDELAIQAATELGASTVIPWQAERSISRWDEAKRAKGVARWQTICDEAAKQSLRAWFPTVQQPLSTERLSKLSSTLLVLDPTAELSIVDAKLPESGEVLLVVGPEGGISESELSLLENAGATRVHLGAGILRTSTAGVAAIAYLAGVTGQWR